MRKLDHNKEMDITISEILRWCVGKICAIAFSISAIFHEAET